MRNECGKSIDTLVIMTILIIIGVVVIINYAQQMMDETKEEDLAKINEIKDEYLKGTVFSKSPVEVQEATRNILHKYLIFQGKYIIIMLWFFIKKKERYQCKKTTIKIQK